MKKAIVIENLTKTYGDLKAVDNISFYVEEGSLFAFLGPKCCRMLAVSFHI